MISRFLGIIGNIKIESWVFVALFMMLLGILCVIVYHDLGLGLHCPLQVGDKVFSILDKVDGYVVDLNKNGCEISVYAEDGRFITNILSESSDLDPRLFKKLED